MYSNVLGAAGGSAAAGAETVTESGDIIDIIAIIDIIV